MNGPRLRIVGRWTLVLAVAIVAIACGAAPAEAGRGWCYRPYHWGGYWGSYWGSPYYGWGGYWGPAYGYTTVYPVAGATHGALDLDVSPETAEIYVDGQLVGKADDFDGFPDFLWLEKGTYDVAIFLPGFQTIARQYSIYAGQIIDVGDRMTPGQETRPEDLVSKSTEHRDERLRRDRENEEELRAAEQSGEWPEESRPFEEPRSDSLDARGEPGRAVVRIAPNDASVYLDGRFLGTGSELSRLRSGLIVDAGEHELEIVRPGYQSTSRGFSVRSGEEVELVIQLEAE
jgi:hypothetical protein